MSGREIIRITTEEQLQASFAIRTKVFVEEQQVPVELELDEHDQTAVHVLAYDEEGHPVATGRMIDYGNGAGKLQRIAVLAPARKGGYGRLVIDKLEELGRSLGYSSFVLEAQTHAEGFYEKLGYVNVSAEPFLDAGIWHVKMVKDA